MSKINLKEICYDLIDTFLLAGKKSLELRKDGLITEYKEDNTPVSNGDLEVDKILNKKISNITPSLPIISEESSQNKSEKNLSIEQIKILKKGYNLRIVKVNKATLSLNTPKDKRNIINFIKTSKIHQNLLKKIGIQKI